MRLGLDVSQHQLTWEELLERVRFAEQAGFEGAWVFDHFKALYGAPSGPCLEGWTLLAALAASTTRIRLGPLVTGVTYRHPAVLTAEAVTVDHVSGGRVEFAVGAAWFEREHRELGIPFPPPAERARRLEEAVQVARLLMTEDVADFTGRYYRLRGASYNPKPVQKPHPPMWIGASGERLMLPIAARHADAWHVLGRPEALVGKARRFDDLVARAGRDPGSVLRATNLSLSEPWDEVRRAVDTLREAGFRYLTVSWPSEGRGRLEEFVETVMPEIAAA